MKKILFLLFIVYQVSVGQLLRYPSPVKIDSVTTLDTLKYVRLDHIPTFDRYRNGTHDTIVPYYRIRNGVYDTIIVNYRMRNGVYDTVVATYRIRNGVYDTIVQAPRIRTGLNDTNTVVMQASDTSFIRGYQLKDLLVKQDSVMARLNQLMLILRDTSGGKYLYLNHHPLFNNTVLDSNRLWSLWYYLSRSDTAFNNGKFWNMSRRLDTIAAEITSLTSRLAVTQDSLNLRFRNIDSLRFTLNRIESNLKPNYIDSTKTDTTFGAGVTFIGASSASSQLIIDQIIINTTDTMNVEIRDNNSWGTVGANQYYWHPFLIDNATVVLNYIDNPLVLPAGSPLCVKANPSPGHFLTVSTYGSRAIITVRYRRKI